MIRLGTSGFALYPGPSCKDCQAYHGPRDRLWARVLLQQFAREPLAASAIRNLLLREVRPWALRKMTADDVTTRMATLINSGLWHIHAPSHAEPAGGAGSVSDVETEDKDLVDPIPRSPAQREPAAVKVTVIIQLSRPVACPGHPLQLTALGTPSGGTYSWTVSGAELVDGTGATASTVSSLFLRSFKPDNSTGKIPEQNATVSVTYTHPNGTAKDSKPVKIHKIGFVVTDTAITAGVTRANETDDPTGVTLGRQPGVETMVTDPKVQIKLDASCPRKADCAKNHRVGWLQSVISVDRRIRYTHTLIQITKTKRLPVRDGNPNSGPSLRPFYDDVFDFVDDNDTRTANHHDSPGTGATWTDSRPDAPVPPPPLNKQLRNIYFQIGFHAWLVVQHKEWRDHDLPGSFAYQKHFDWSTHLDVSVDTTKAAGSRCTPQSVAPTIGAMGDGKGSNDPNLDPEVSNNLNKTEVLQAPGI
jgi:hypothetical protein